MLLEYVEWAPALPGLAAALASGGYFSVVLQLPSPSCPAVTPTEFASLQSLESLFRFVAPEALIAAAGRAGLTLDSRRSEPLNGGKAFEVLRFVKGEIEPTIGGPKNE